jgi:hypothetical protein
MTAIEQYTDPYLAIYRQPPMAGVCIVCHSGPGIGYRTCYSCDATMRQVARPTRNFLPISLYEVQGQFWHMLRYYKDGTQQQQPLLLGTILAATIARFTARHWSCICSLLGGEPGIVTTVPSTRIVPRPGEHPLVTVVKRISHLSDLYVSILARGAGAVGHLNASDHAFTVTHDVRGQRVLVIEDTFTSGARMQSAASALQLAGTAGLAVVAAGRVIKPSYNENCQLIWDQASRRAFSFDTCCMCGG